MPRAFKWVTKSGGAEALAASAQVGKDLLPSFPTDNIKGCTVTRIVGFLHVKPDTVAQASFTSFGIVLVNADSLSAGAFPDADIDADNVAWFVRGMTVNHVASLSVDSESRYWAYDLRAQRIMRSDKERLVLVLDQNNGGGVLLNYHWRTLLKLP